MKRRAPSPALSSPPLKRRHLSFSPSDSLESITIADLSDELFLSILIHLSSPTLSAAQLVCRDWCRLARDNQLWKHLFLRDHPASHLKSVSGSGSGRRRAHDPYRPIRALPARALHPVDGTVQGREREEGPLDWRWMYKLSANWASGFCKMSSVVLPPSSNSTAPSLAGTPARCPTPSAIPTTLPFASARMHLLGPYVVSSLADSHTVQLHLPPRTPGGAFRFLGQYQPFPSLSRNEIITALQPDESPSSPQLASFSSRGHIVIHTFPSVPSPTSSDITPSLTHTYLPAGGLARPITCSAFSSPLLCTLNSAFTLHIYRVPPSSATGPVPVELLHTLHSFTSFPPASLSVSLPPPPTTSIPSRTSSPDRSRSSFPTARLTLHHLTPAYPSHWVPSAHQFVFSLPSFNITADRSWAVGGWVPSAAPSDEESEESEGWDKRVRKMGSVGGVVGDAKGVLIAGDGALHLHRLRPTTPYLTPALSLPLPFSNSARTKVTALATHARSPRCVAALSTGQLVVWDIDAQAGVVLPSAFVDHGELEDADESDTVRKKTEVIREVRLDEGRVVGLVVVFNPSSMETSERLVVWDFDC